MSSNRPVFRSILLLAVVALILIPAILLAPRIFNEPRFLTWFDFPSRHLASAGFGTQHRSNEPLGGLWSGGLGTDHARSVSDQLNRERRSLLWSYWEEQARTLGCFKTDQELFYKDKIFFKEGPHPSEKMLGTSGTIFFPKTPMLVKDGVLEVDQDECFIKNNKGVPVQMVREWLCEPQGQGFVAVYEEYACRTGTTCISGACVPVGPNGCFAHQPPFLDSNLNGQLDACYCPGGLLAQDADQDDNSDSCGWKGGVCELSESIKKDSGIVTKSSGVGDEHWEILNYCSSPVKLAQVACTQDKAANIAGIQSVTESTCDPGDWCVAGNCGKSEFGACDPTEVHLEPEIKGWITIAKEDNSGYTTPDKCELYCELYDPDSPEFDQCTRKVHNVYCVPGQAAIVAWMDNLCPEGSTCAEGVCVSGSWSSPSNPPNPSNPSGGKSGKKGCGMTIGCKEFTDTSHPYDPFTGSQLYGDPYLYGQAVAITEFCGALKADDDCKWNEYEPLPELLQWGCEEDFPRLSMVPCDWEAGEACDWHASAPEGGICKAIKQEPVVKAYQPTKYAKGGVSGINAFGHSFNHSDECIMPPDGGESVKIKKWKLADGPEGVVTYNDTCPPGYSCQGEIDVCLPYFCTQFDGVFPDDGDPCTKSHCSNNNEFIFHLPIKANEAGELLDDSDACTTDSCVVSGGKAKFTHTPIGMAFCTGEKPLENIDCNDPMYDDHPDCPLVKSACTDSDPDNNKAVKGTVRVFPGTPGELMALDGCFYPEGKDETLVLQAGCGLNFTIVFTPIECKKDETCKDGMCQENDPKP